MKQCSRHAAGAVVVQWSDAHRECPLCQIVEELEATKATGGGTSNTLERVTNHVVDQVDAWDEESRKAADLSDFRRMGEARAVGKALREIRTLIRGS